MFKYWSYSLRLDEARDGEELLNDGLDVSISLLRDLELSSDSLENIRVLGSNVIKISSLEGLDVRGGDLIEVSSNTSIENAHLLLRGHGNVLLLLDELGEFLTSQEKLLGGGIEIGTELGESSDLSELGKIKLDGTRHLLHGLDLSSGSDTGDGETDVNGRSDTLMEKIRFQEDLSISNRDDIGGDISRKITSLSLNNGQSGQGTSTVGFVHLGCSFQKAGVQVEDISGVSLTTWRSSKEERHLSVGDGLLGEIIIDDESVLAVISEVLTNSAAGVRGQELERSRVGGSSGDDAGVVHSLFGLKDSNNVGDGGSLLTDGGVDAVELLLGVILVEVLLLIDDGIDGDGSLTSLSITNDELTLSSTNRDEGIDTLEASLHGLVDRLSGDDTRSLKLNTLFLIGLNRAKTINGVTKGVDNTAKHALTNWDIDNGTSSLDNITFLDLSIVTKDDNTNIISLQVKGHTLDTGGELNHLSGLNLHETEYTSDTITNGNNSTKFFEVSLNIKQEITYNLVDSGNLRLEDGNSVTNGRFSGGGSLSGLKECLLAIKVLSELGQHFLL